MICSLLLCQTFQDFNILFNFFLNTWVTWRVFLKTYVNKDTLHQFQSTFSLPKSAQMSCLPCVTGFPFSFCSVRDETKPMLTIARPSDHQRKPMLTIARPSDHQRKPMLTIARPSQPLNHTSKSPTVLRRSTMRHLWCETKFSGPLTKEDSSSRRVNHLLPYIKMHNKRPMICLDRPWVSSTEILTMKLRPLFTCSIILVSSTVRVFLLLFFSLYKWSF